MIGFKNPYANDANTSIVNGQWDDDLDALEASIKERRQRRAYPSCPECGEPMNGMQHIHETETDNGQVWTIEIFARKKVENTPPLLNRFKGESKERPFSHRDIPI